MQGQGPYCEAGVVEAFHPLGPPDTHRVQDLAAACDGAHGQAWGWSMAKLRRIGRTVPERLEDPAASTVAGILRARVARAAVVLIAAAPFLHFLEMCEERRELARLRRGRGRECGGDGGGGGRASAGAWSAHSEVALAFTRRGDRIQAAVVRYRSPPRLPGPTRLVRLSFAFWLEKGARSPTHQLVKSEPNATPHIY